MTTADVTDPDGHPLAGRTHGTATGVATGAVRVPDRCAHLPRDAAGWPIPWHAAPTEPGEDPHDRFLVAVRFDRCYTCGHPRGRHATFIVPPSCVIAGLTFAPPSHADCAAWEALTRRPAPGAAPGDLPPLWALWASRTWEVIPVPGAPGADDRVGFWLDDPTALSWVHAGRPAFPAEVTAGLAAGLTALLADPEVTAAGAEHARRVAAHLAALAGGAA